MTWPFKIYGREIGSVENLVELALQSSNGSVRVWAFSASGEASILDVDTYTSSAQDVVTVPCMSLIVGSESSLESARLLDRASLGILSLRSYRKRKSGEVRDDFACLCGPVPLYFEDPRETNGSYSPLHRPSFAACIVDFKVPRLGLREGL